MTPLSKPTTETASQSFEVVKKAETYVDLILNGELNTSQYVGDKEPDKKTIKDIQDWAVQQRETTRAKLAMRLATCLGGSLTATYLLMGIAAFNPNADKAFLKDLLPQVITPQVTLLGVALGYYFGVKEDD